MTLPYAPEEVRRLLDALVAQMDAVEGAVLLSSDGLVVAASSEIDQEHAEHLSAVVAGVQGLARGACRRFDGGELLQSVIEMDEVLLFMVPAGDDGCLAALSGAGADAGAVSYAVTELAERIGERSPLRSRLSELGARDPA